MLMSITVVQDIIHAIGAPVLVIQRNRIVMVNAEAEAWFGLPADTLINDYTPYSLLHPSTRRNALQFYLDKQSTTSHEPPAEKRLAITHPTQGMHWVDVSIGSLPLLDNTHHLITVHTAKVSSGEQHHKEATPVSFRHTQRAEMIQQNPALTDMVINTHFNDRVLEEFLDTLYAVIPYDSASIALYHNDDLKFVAAQGRTVEMSLETLTLNIGKPVPQPVDATYKTSLGVAHVINDVIGHPEWIYMADTDHIRGWMAVELNYKNVPIGLLYIDSVTPHFFSKQHAHQAIAMAQQAVTALVHVRLYQQYYFDLEERHRLQEILVQNLISTETLYATQDLLFSADSLYHSLPEVMLIMSSALKQTRLMITVFNVATGTLRHALQHDMQSEEAWQYFSNIVTQPEIPYATMPLKDISLPTNGYMQLETGEHAIAATIENRGLLLALRDSHQPEFSESEHELISTVANHVGIALKNELLEAQLRQHTQHLEKQVQQRTADLQFERSRLQAILDSTGEGIFYMEDFLIQYTNPAFCNMVGYHADELKGQPLSMIRVEQKNELAQNFEALFKESTDIDVGRNETRLRHRDGTEFHADIRFSLVGLPGDDSVRMVAIARDISQERKLYFQRARFIANAAHELRTPMTSLILRLHLLRRQPDKVATHLESLDKVSEYLRELVEELLTLSRFERGSIELAKSDYALQPLIHAATEAHLSFADERQVAIHYDMPDDDVIAMVDSSRFKQMMSNLILNGINYAKEEGTVDISMTVDEDTLGNRNAIIHVKNDGEGIAADLLPHDIFEPFSRPSEGSRKETGMGLALAREITTLHNGSIHAQNNNEGGATFRVTLPIN
ncbi:MAG: ATP-binding protein [Chloroflexota bacterium]